jgi:FixJ family two-component response regulator
VSPAEICVVDDNAATLKAVDRLLSYAHWEAKTFSDPQQFLRYSKTHRPPVAVIDLSMPAMNGLEVQLRLREISPSTRVIIFTGNESQLSRAAALRAGAVAFFNKPFNDDEFLAAVCTAFKP